MKPTMTRLRARRNSILSRSYLAYRALWPVLIDAIESARSLAPQSSPCLVLDIGCGEKPYADFFAGTRYIGMNYSREGASPDVLGDAQNLPFQSGCANIVFSTQVIEHVPEPAKLVNEAFRVLEPKGVFVLSGPFYWPLHEEPYDFQRFTKHGFRHLLESAGFQVISIESDAKSMTQAAVAFIEALPRSLKLLIPVVNVMTPLLQALSKDTRCTLNYVCIAQKP